MSTPPSGPSGPGLAGAPGGPASPTGQPGEITPGYVAALCRAAAVLLPPGLDDPRAWRLVAAIGWQESRWRWRRQQGGPARSFFQFERAGIRGVLAHPSTVRMAARFAAALGYPPREDALFAAIEHQDVLAVGFGRLALWALPDPLPDTAELAWRQYLAAWRPGHPRPKSWPAAWAWAGLIGLDTEGHSDHDATRLPPYVRG